MSTETKQPWWRRGEFWLNTCLTACFGVPLLTILAPFDTLPGWQNVLMIILAAVFAVGSFWAAVVLPPYPDPTLDINEPQ